MLSQSSRITKKQSEIVQVQEQQQCSQAECTVFMETIPPVVLYSAHSGARYRNKFVPNFLIFVYFLLATYYSQ
jgi:hypothetical protein